MWCPTRGVSIWPSETRHAQHEKCGWLKGGPQGCSLRSHRRRRLAPLPPPFSQPLCSAMSSMHRCCSSELKRRGIFQRSREGLIEIDAALDDFVSNLHSRLIRSRELRKGRTGSIVDIHPIIFLSPGTASAEGADDVESTVCSSLEGLAGFLRS